MGKIKILSDTHNVYSVGEVYPINKIIKDYTSQEEDIALTDYVWRIPIPAAIQFIAEKWGFEYQFV